MALSGTAIRRNTIDVYGITGEFKILKGGDGNPVTVKYFQTVASNRDDDESGNAIDLLSELKPMRERVGSEDLKDLRSLLQRDLSDYRVANDLVPYLKGFTSTVGFFPSILVALLPSGYLKDSSGVAYPAGELQTGTDGRLIKYSTNWSVENYKIDDSIVSLAKLSVDPNCTDFIVLDGQHRANAFRFMAGTFDAATDDASIYSAFYQNCGDHEPQEFDAELPVTIVWFDCENGNITPSLISRKLFVDVNTTAKTVSDSRNILLNDRDFAAIATTSLYSALAEQGYSSSNLSLLHAGFDCEGTSFPSDYPRMTLFSPKTMHYMLSYLLLSRPRHLEMGNKISNESYGSFGDWLNRVKDICPEITDEIIDGVGSAQSLSVAAVDCAYKSTIVPYIVRLLTEFNFLKPHLEACEKIDKSITTHGSSEKISAWERIFKGGEGLYNAFAEAARRRETLSGRLATYKRAVDEINEEFSSERNSIASGYGQAIDTFISQAGMTGIFMALLKCYEEEGWGDELLDKFLNALNSYSVEEWTLIFSVYKTQVVRELNPKLWPSIREIILRFVEEKSDWNWGLTAGDIKTYHPDYLFCKKSVTVSLKAWYRENTDEDSKPSSEEQTRWISNSIEQLTSFLSSIQLELKNAENLRSALETYMSDELEDED